METFVIDTCTLINLETYYNKKIFISLWEELEKMVSNNLLFSVMEVKRELEKKDDVTSKYWNNIHNKYDFFIDYTELNNSTDYSDAIGELEVFENFQKGGEEKEFWADPYLIAMGMVDNSIVITSESASNKPTKKIPYVCKKMDVKCMNMRDFMLYQEWHW